ncbi:hypothetical protein OG754_40140 (plasmid) [Streptomyces decoyicus]|uniref:hypothetical protein n=1 Tax=Streptomyces decoyicus TaxID=249567 RepID=UPI002E31C402|nr:hypothetical protein [Streptomyces decoyicus]
MCTDSSGPLPPTPAEGLLPDVPGTYPVSLAQRERLALWASGRHSQDQPTDAWSFGCEITAREARFAWDAVIGRYETLRSVFVQAADGTFHCRRDDAETVAARTFVVASPEEFFPALCAPVDLIGGALARLVVSHGAGETLIGMSFDHLVIDGHTFDRVSADFFARLNGADLPGPAPSSADAFYRAELRAAASPAGEKALAYWRRTTDGATYPPLLAGMTRPSGAPVIPETGHAAVAFDASAHHARMALGRSAMVLASVAAAIVRTLDLETDSEPFRILLQSSRRSSPAHLTMAGFLSNWQVASFAAGRDARQMTDDVGDAVFRSMRCHQIHHAEVVNRLEPELYGARYVPSEPLPPYALFNYLSEQKTPVVRGHTGAELDVPPMGAYRLHGALRVYGIERTDGSGAAVRVIADASVFGAGFAAAVAQSVGTMATHGDPS